MTYRCPTCGAESRREGECDNCGVEMEKVCEDCGEIRSECACRSGFGEEDEGQGEGS